MSHVIQIAPGCSISTASRALLQQQLTLQGCPKNGLAEAGIGAEFFKPEKNPLFEEGMSPNRLIMKTLDHCAPFIGKLNLHTILAIDKRVTKDKPTLIKRVQSKGCHLVYMYRTNKLDQALCYLRDFGENAKQYRAMLVSKGMIKDTFFSWRHSSYRRDFVFHMQIETIIEKVQQLVEEDQQLMQLVQEEQVLMHRVPADELLAYQTSNDPSVLMESQALLGNVLDFLGVAWDSGILTASLKEEMNTRPPPYRHSALAFGSFSPDDLRAALNDEGLIGFWRE